MPLSADHGKRVVVALVPGVEAVSELTMRGDLRVASRCHMRVNVMASTAFEAVDKARAHHVPLLQAALSLRQPDLPYRIQLVAAENGVEAHPAGGRGQFTFFMMRQ